MSLPKPWKRTTAAERRQQRAEAKQARGAYQAERRAAWNAKYARRMADPEQAAKRRAWYARNRDKQNEQRRLRLAAQNEATKAERLAKQREYQGRRRADRRAARLQAAINAPVSIEKGLADVLAVWEAEKARLAEQEDC